eukprot:TRINITY_DN12861_c0_g1_i1.p1 TRINITY_DN12861_c0_g1~~TRINITY_DN12861_c0_g1_i1.p1  ORF type:complete len:378 (-),score=54.72 TRINITY_DN12861_c0_g1_i1:848-1981(-)
MYKLPPREPSHFVTFVRWLVDTPAFNAVILVTIFMNIITIAVQTDDVISINYVLLFTATDLTFLMIYTMEFVLRLIAGNYWENSFNRFDFVVLLLSYLQLLELVLQQLSFFRNFQFLRVLRAVRALRALRSISFIRSLQVIVTALLATMGEILNLFLLLMLLMYVFAVIAFFSFGDAPAVQGIWSSIPTALLAEFAYVTADGWADLQMQLDEVTYMGRLFAIGLLFFGHFIFTNLFIGLVIQNLDDATEDDLKIRRDARETLIRQHRIDIELKQRLQMESMLTAANKQQKQKGTIDLQEALAERVGKLSHKEHVAVSDTAANLTWVETYLTTLNHKENSMYRVQQIQFELANLLTDMLERRIEQRIDKGASLPDTAS